MLGRDATSKSTKGTTRVYDELLAGRFKLTKVVRIDHTDDGDNVAGKIFDYSYKTVEKLVGEGSRDALIQLDRQLLKDQVKESTQRYPRYNGKQKQKEDYPMQLLEGYLDQIQETLKNGNTQYSAVAQIVAALIRHVDPSTKIKIDHCYLKKRRQH